MKSIKGRIGTRTNFYALSNLLVENDWKRLNRTIATGDKECLFSSIVCQFWQFSAVLTIPFSNFIQISWIVKENWEKSEGNANKNRKWPKNGADEAATLTMN